MYSRSMGFSKKGCQRMGYLDASDAVGERADECWGCDTHRGLRRRSHSGVNRDAETLRLSGTQAAAGPSSKTLMLSTPAGASVGASWSAAKAKEARSPIGHMSANSVAC